MKAILTILGMAVGATAGAADLVIHEWGTFTSFQDARGATIPGINVDDEPVPRFVHRLDGLPVFTTRSTPATWSQGAPRCHPEVTLRLETPVLYFYPQPGFPRDRKIDVGVKFTGGWLTEFFPFATAGTPGFPNTLGNATLGSLRWTGLRLDTDTSPSVMLTQTDERVWLAPRKVSSATVIATGGEQGSLESEKYLFYRGVGHVDAPIVVRQAGRSLIISLREGTQSLQALPFLWVVHVSPDGRVQYQNIDPAGKNTVTAAIPNGGTSPTMLPALRQELAVALKKEGLFDDEAQAMLETWRLSYFESEGARVFFVLPPAWTDAQLPLSVSTPADITRVMLGRVEIVSDHQSAKLHQLKKLPDSAFNLTPPYLENPDLLKHLNPGAVHHADFYRKMGREVPEALRLYDSLGRFRDALLAHESSAATDAATRKRLQLIMRKFSACVPAGS